MCIAGMHVNFNTSDLPMCSLKILCVKRDLIAFPNCQVWLINLLFNLSSSHYVKPYSVGIRGRNTTPFHRPGHIYLVWKCILPFYIHPFITLNSYACHVHLPSVSIAVATFWLTTYMIMRHTYTYWTVHVFYLLYTEWKCMYSALLNWASTSCFAISNATERLW